MKSKSDKIDQELLAIVVSLLTEIRDLLKESKAEKESRLPRRI